VSGYVLATFGERVHDTLRDLLDFAELARELVARGKETYDGDVLNRLAAEAIVHRMGEAINRLPPAFTAAHPDVEWPLIKGMRNVVAHQCGNVDHDLLWNALSTDIPHDAAKIRAILER
jgi:uncharacterized protein with HEPN domain